jgi:hypothetical protein
LPNLSSSGTLVRVRFIMVTPTSGSLNFIVIVEKTPSSQFLNLHF